MLLQVLIFPVAVEVNHPSAIVGKSCVLSTFVASCATPITPHFAVWQMGLRRFHRANTRKMRKMRLTGFNVTGLRRPPVCEPQFSLSKNQLWISAPKTPWMRLLVGTREVSRPACIWQRGTTRSARGLAARSGQGQKARPLDGFSPELGRYYPSSHGHSLSLGPWQQSLQSLLRRHGLWGGSCGRLHVQ